MTDHRSSLADARQAFGVFELRGALFDDGFEMTRVALQLLFGIRRDTEEKIDQGFYDPELLEECLLAKCPGQGWRFALRCCRKQQTK